MTETDEPSPARTQRRGKTAAPASHQCTMRTGPETREPAATSRNTGSGANASLRRTSASPPCCTEPSMSGAASTSSAPPRLKGAPPSEIVTACVRPLCTSTVAAALPTSAPSDDSRSFASGGAARVAFGRAELLQVEVVNRRVPPDLFALGGQRRRRKRLVTGGPAPAEPVRSGEAGGCLGAECVQGQVLFRVRMRPMHSSGPPRGLLPGD